MLKIGEFSRLCQVTVKTLRHYDNIGLLKPASIDKFTSYRFYTLEQLPRVHRIMALKEMGLSLDQIARMIDNDLPTEQLRGMLTLKEAEVQQQIDQEQTRLARIKFHIRQIDMEANMSQLDIRIKKIDPVRALTIRFFAKDHGDIERVGKELQNALRENGLHPADASSNSLPQPFQIVYADEYNQQDIDTEMAVPVDDNWTTDLPLTTAGILELREVDGVEEAATYIYEGDPDEINDNLVDLQKWVASNGYQLSNEIRMVVLRGAFENLPPEEWLHEIQYPLQKA